jgi:hypothetical protein
LAERDAGGNFVMLNKTPWLLIPVVGLFAATSSVVAQQGNGAPNGAHYSLNIIGVENPKTADMTGSNRHTIFVGLGRTGQVTSKIYLTRGDFAVCDGNAFDPAFDCTGDQIQSEGAVFQLPCNTNLPDDQDTLIPCDAGDTASYEVWVRALGQPGGSSTTTTCAFDPDLNDVVCSTENVLLVREKGRSLFENKTKELTSLVTDIDGDGDLDRVALFQSNLEDWFWQYQNRGLRLAQVRFYLLD